MKPRITKTSDNNYWCIVPVENEPGEDATVADWYNYASCGCGATPVEAYRDWVLECLRYEQRDKK